MKSVTKFYILTIFDIKIFLNQTTSSRHIMSAAFRVVVEVPINPEMSLKSVALEDCIAERYLQIQN